MAASNADSSADANSPVKNVEQEVGGDPRAKPPYLIEVCPNVHSLVLAVSLPDLRRAEEPQVGSKAPGTISDAARDDQESSCTKAVERTPHDVDHDVEDRTSQSIIDGNGILAGMLVTPFQAVIDGEEYKFPMPVEPRSMRQALRRLDNYDPKFASSGGGTETRVEGGGRADIELRFALQHVKGTARPSNAVRHRHFDAVPLLHVGFLSRATRLACSQCNATLTRPPPILSEASPRNLGVDGVPQTQAEKEIRPVFERTRALPSSTWHELVECWACHEQAITMPSAGDAAAAEPGTCLVGASFLIVHREQLLSGTGGHHGGENNGGDGTGSAIVWRDHSAVGTHPGWSTAAPAAGTTCGPSQRARAVVAHCAKCDTVLGIRARARVEFPPTSYGKPGHSETIALASAPEAPSDAVPQHTDGLPIDFGAHLFKTAVIAEEQVDAPTPAPPLAWNRAKIAQHALMAELLDLVTAHATPRALLVDVLAPRRPVVALWVLNWNCRVRTRAFASARALKVLYRDLRCMAPPPPRPHGPGDAAAPSCGHVDGSHRDEANERTIRSTNAAANALDRGDALALLPLPDPHLLVHLLANANAALPPSQRAAELLGETWNVSYLMQ